MSGHRGLVRRSLSRVKATVLNGYRRGPRKATLRRLLGPMPWCVDNLEQLPSEIRFSGWALSPDADRLALTWNGQPLTAVEYGLKRRDLARLFWYVPRAGHSGFRASVPLSPWAAYPDGRAEIQCRNQPGLAPYPWHSYYSIAEAEERYPFPDVEYMHRVLGGTTQAAFALEGFSAFAKIERAIGEYAGTTLRDLRRILDWGCGCGRVTRYLPRIGPAVEITGVDIDATNIEWCVKNLPVGRFNVVPLHPPTRLPEASFDLIIGVSVFTHLSETTQFEWLEELNRLSAPGGLVAVTVHGDAAVARAGFYDRTRRNWIERGFHDTASADLGGELTEPEYYRLSFHSNDYVRRKWTRWFDVVAIIPSCIGNFHDLVLMRRKAS